MLEFTVEIAGERLDKLIVAEMGDGTLLMAKTYVDVATNGCI
jgi:hypothetical protein